MQPTWARRKWKGKSTSENSSKAIPPGPPAKAQGDLTTNRASNRERLLGKKVKVDILGNRLKMRERNNKRRWLSNMHKDGNEGGHLEYFLHWRQENGSRVWIKLLDSYQGFCSYTHCNAYEPLHLAHTFSIQSLTPIHNTINTQEAYCNKYNTTANEIVIRSIIQPDFS